MALLNLFIPYRRQRIRSEGELRNALSARTCAKKALNNAERDLNMLKLAFLTSVLFQCLRVALSLWY